MRSVGQPRDRSCQCQTLLQGLSHLEIEVVSVRLCSRDLKIDVVSVRLCGRDLEIDVVSVRLCSRDLKIDVVSVRLYDKDCPTQRSTLSVSDFVTRTVPPRDRRCQCQTL